MMQLLSRFGSGDRSGSPLAGTGTTPVGTGSAERIVSRNLGGRASNGRQFHYRAGLPIDRPLSPNAAATQFVAWMRSQGFCGEYLWRDVIEYFAWFAAEEKLVPMPEQQHAMFAHELAKLCRRGQVRMNENGRRRRLTTYLVPAPAELAAA